MDFGRRSSYRFDRSSFSSFLYRPLHKEAKSKNNRYSQPTNPRSNPSPGTGSRPSSPPSTEKLVQVIWSISSGRWGRWGQSFMISWRGFIWLIREPRPRPMGKRRGKHRMEKKKKEMNMREERIASCCGS